MLETEEQATCVGCGCTDSNACPGGCSWTWVKRDEGRGWCAACNAIDPLRRIVAGSPAEEPVARTED